MPEIRVLTPALALLGENPIWDVETQRLYWLDVFGRAIFRCTADGRELTVWNSQQMSGLALRSGGGAVAVAGRQVLLYDIQAGSGEVVFEGELPFNDCKIDRQGRLVTGTVAPEFADPAHPVSAGAAAPGAGLYRLDTDLTMHLFGDGVAVSNGPTFSPDGTRLYWSDSGTRQVYKWDYDSDAGSATNRTVHGDFNADTPAGSAAVPDGATVDAEGCRWVACFLAGEVRRYTPGGTLDFRLSLPVNNPTSVAFGGPDLDVLFITSLSMNDFPGNPHQSGPLDGTLLAVHGLGCVGLPELRFAG